MRVAISVLRRSSTIWGGLAVAAIDVWLAISARLPGLNLWADLVTGLGTASLFTGAVGAGAAAFEANRWARSSQVRLRFAARTPVWVRAVHAATVIAPILAGYLLALLTLGVYAGLTGAYGSPSASWLTASGAALVLAATMGYLLGSTGVGRWWVAPAAAVLFYAAYVLSQAGQLPRGAQALFPVVSDLDSVFLRTVTSTRLGEAAVWVGLAILAVLLVGGGWRRGTARRRLICFAAVAGLLIVGGVVPVVARDGESSVAVVPHDLVCDSGGVTICLNRGYGLAMVPLKRQLGEMNTRAAGTALVATRVEQNLEGGTKLSAAARAIYLEQLAGHDDIAFAVFRYVKQYGAASRGCTSYGGGEDLVDNWLSGYDDFYGRPLGVDHLAALRALSPKVGNEWFRAHARAYFSCTLRLADLP